MRTVESSAGRQASQENQRGFRTSGRARPTCSHIPLQRVDTGGVETPPQDGEGQDDRDEPISTSFSSLPDKHKL